MVFHPARYSSGALEAAVSLLPPAPARILDPFAGCGGIHDLRDAGYDTIGVEIEPEWARSHPGTIEGDARFLPFRDHSIEAIVTSPAYGNRMADSYDGRDGSMRMTYRVALGRELSPGSGAGLQWGNAYRVLHEQAWIEARRVLRRQGTLVLNISDHIRKGRVQAVTQWHVETLQGIGFTLTGVHTLQTSRMRCGANRTLRVPHEWVIGFRAP